MVKRRCRAILIGALLGTLPDVFIDPASAGQHPLEGTWSGDGLTLRIDADAALANKNPARPFDWESFYVRHARGPMVVFMIGSTQFIGRFEADALLVTRIDEPGTWRLRRSELYPATARQAM